MTELLKYYISMTVAVLLSSCAAPERLGSAKPSAEADIAGRWELAYMRIDTGDDYSISDQFVPTEKVLPHHPVSLFISPDSTGTGTLLCGSFRTRYTIPGPGQIHFHEFQYPAGACRPDRTDSLFVQGITGAEYMDTGGDSLTIVSAGRVKILRFVKK